MRDYAIMRTTLSIDDDLAEAIERLRGEQNLSLREAVNRLLRAGLETARTPVDARPYDGPAFDSQLMPGIDSMRMNQLADELETDAFAS
jgi:Arc/MetJ family transcription regulator